MGSYNGVKLCDFIGTYLLSQLCTIKSKNNCWFYRDGGLIIQEYINGQQIYQLRKKIVKIFKENSFKTHTEKNLKIVDFLDLAFNLINSSYKLYKKCNTHYCILTEIKKPSPKDNKKNYQNQSTTDYISCIKNRISNSIKKQFI